jgi:heme exporter protein CcmD
MMDVPHLGFIVAAYGLAALVVLVMIGAILWDYRALSAALRRLDAARAEREPK